MHHGRETNGVELNRFDSILFINFGCGNIDTFNEVYGEDQVEKSSMRDKNYGQPCCFLFFSKISSIDEKYLGIVALR